MRKIEFKKQMTHGDPRAMLDTLARSKAPMKLYKGKGKVLKGKAWGS